ncbi:glycoside hydrolase family 19 protein [Roseospira visakhapatnamensis]|uniref:Putative chitinase n=1 Tax=Roseospira visakhapatnamensis TaxID=390880 RepID=A0A7W6WBF3_9PROT|nr:glycoside hydrolase family 19 protein [Roseospira visakhapatnamensis]MBB4267783.1 putative chitinase [Roseospira visakhapatnamensis]
MPAPPVLPTPIRPTEAVLFATAGGRLGTRQVEIVSIIAAEAPSVLPPHEIATLPRVAHLLAQLAHESDHFRTTEEYASGAAYEGRRDLGNTRPGDGRRYKGRGLIQLTGRYNYALFGRRLGIDLEADPHRAAEPGLSLRIAAAYWTDRGLNPLADADDIRAITRRINGGTNGLPDRVRCLERARTALTQQRLADLGHDPGPIDGRWGPRTSAGLAAAGSALGLPAATPRAAVIQALWET